MAAGSLSLHCIHVLTLLSLQMRELTYKLQGIFFFLSSSSGALALSSSPKTSTPEHYKFTIIFGMQEGYYNDGI